MMVFYLFIFLNEKIEKNGKDDNDEIEEAEELPIQIAMNMMPDYEIFSQEDQKCSSEEEGR